MKQLIIMRGMTGSGKTTHANKMAASFRQAGQAVVICSADDWWTEERPFHPRELGNAHADCQAEAVRAMHDCVDVVIIDNTNTRHSEYTFYHMMAEHFGYQTLYSLHHPTTPEDALQCALRNTHNVPLAKAMEMYERFEFGTHPLFPYGKQIG